MNRRDFLITSSLASLASLRTNCLSTGVPVSSNSSGGEQPAALGLLPFPQQLTVTPGSVAIGKPQYRFHQEKTPTLQIAMKSLLAYAGDYSGQLMVNLGSLEEGYERTWLSAPDNQWLAADGTNSEASVISIT